MFVGEVSPVLAQSRQQHHLWRLHSNVPQRRGQLCLSGQGDDSRAHAGKHTHTLAYKRHMKGWKTDGGLESERMCADKRGRWGRKGEGETEKGGGSNRREGPASQERMRDPEEVCCHGDQCGLFFFWMLLTACGPRIGIRLPCQPSTNPSHSHRWSGERARNQAVEGRNRVGRWPWETDDATFVSWRSQPCFSSSASLNSYIVTELFVYVGAPSDASLHQSVCSLVSFCLRNVRRKTKKNSFSSTRWWFLKVLFCQLKTQLAFISDKPKTIFYSRFLTRWWFTLNWMLQ